MNPDLLGSVAEDDPEHGGLGAMGDDDLP